MTRLRRKQTAQEWLILAGMLLLGMLVWPRSSHSVAAVDQSKAASPSTSPSSASIAAAASSSASPSASSSRLRRVAAPSPLAARLLAAAHAEADKHTLYKQEYVVLSYPGGDVPAAEGVCTDFIVRSFRAIGLDLQKTLHEDRVAHPEAYPTQLWPYKKSDANIDHRRCQNLIVWFRRFATALPTSLDRAAIDQIWQAGDVVFFAQTRTEYPTHVAIISDGRDVDGMPLLLDNYPPHASESHRLDEFQPILAHFRLSEKNLRAILGEKVIHTAAPDRDR